MLFVLFSLLPYVCLGGTVLAFWSRAGASGKPFFASLLDGAIFWSLAVWAASNGLSVVNGIYGWPFIVFWLCYAGVLACFIWRRRGQITIPRPGGLLPVSMAIICLGTLASALFYPPNMWDVMTYHLPRVMHWLQNHTMAPYVTSIPRQIGMPPFNSMIALQSLAMGGGDYFVHLGQWAAFLGLIAGSMRLAALLGANRRGQLLAAFFVATLPNAIIQASNTESSDLAAFWTVAMACVFLEWLEQRDRANAVRLGCCIGLAILSKGSAYVTAFPFVLAIAFLCLRRPRLLFKQGVIAACVIIILNAPQLVRTYEAYGSIIGGTERNILYHPTPGTFAVNVIYNFLLHEPWLLRGPLLDMWRGLAAGLGVDENDKGVFPWRGLSEQEAEFQLADTTVPNAPQAILLLCMAIAIVRRSFRPPLLYSSIIGGVFVLYWLILTWHPWAGRIHTSMFALAAPLAGMYMDSWKRERLRKFFIYLLLVWTFFVFQGGMRRLGPASGYEQNFLYHNRNSLYFNNYTRYRQPYTDAVNFLASQAPKSIGLEMYDDAFEYPLWALLRQSVRNMPEIRHILTERDLDNFKPEFILVLGKSGSFINTLAMPYILQRKGRGYVRVFPPEQADE